MPTYIKNPRFSPSELRWYKASFRELAPFLVLGEQVREICGKVDGLAAEPKSLLGDPEHAFTATLERIRHSLEGMILLTSAGHVVDAAAAHASLIETCHTLVHLIGAPSRPGYWAKWRKIDETPWSVRKLVDSSGGMLEWSKERRNEEYELFTLASAFKHHNPLTAQVFRESVGGTVVLAKNTLLDAFDTVLSCVGFYTKNRLIEPARAVFADMIFRAATHRAQLKRAVTRTV